MPATAPASTPAAPTQDVRFFSAPDGVRLAYAVHGEGSPLVNVSCWLSHLQFDWESPVWRHLLQDLGAFRKLVRYDERGSGLSDWEIGDYSVEARTRDLECVVDALGLERFALLGMSQGGPIALEYAVRHPERVSHLVLAGTCARGSLRRGEPTAEDLAELETHLNLIRLGWARDNPVFRRVFTNTFIPDATETQVRWFDDLQRMSTSTENAVHTRRERALVDVTNLLPRVRVPTLVLHSRDDDAIPFEEGVLLASRIPGARFVPLDSRNHILLADEPAWDRFVAELRDFLATEPDPSADGAGHTVDIDVEALTNREAEILRLAAEGLSNQEIGDALTLSVRTVERHFSNIYLRLGVSGKAARSAAVARSVRSAITRR
jgi:pimeloyl-ACP methyl ester carboxylesterase/DNA-binding CsgD family transcriptional regulator